MMGVQGTFVQVLSQLRTSHRTPVDTPLGNDSLKTCETGGPPNPVSPARRPPSLSPAAAHKPSLRDISAACNAPPNVSPVGLGPAFHSDTKIDPCIAELLRLEGRGDYTSGYCLRCSDAIGSLGLRCEDCQDLGLYCVSCSLEIHSRQPVHRLQRWTGKCFKSQSLRDLGLRFQLGHAIGVKCPAAIPVVDRGFILLDLTGIHEINVDFCGCPGALAFEFQVLRQRWFPAAIAEHKVAATFNLLDHAILLSDQFDVPVANYYECLVRVTDNTGVNLPPDHRSTFITMSEEWRTLKALKRAGIGNDPHGGSGVDCPACPQPGKNEFDGETQRARSWFRSLSQNLRAKLLKPSGVPTPTRKVEASSSTITCPHGLKRAHLIGELREGLLTPPGARLLAYTHGCGNQYSDRPVQNQEQLSDSGEPNMLDVLFGTKNWSLVTTMPMILLRRAHEVVPQYEHDVRVYQVLTQCIPAKYTQRWYQLVKKWEKGRKGRPDPRMILRSHLSLAVVAANLISQEMMRTRHRPVKYATSEIVVAGMELEEEQRRLHWHFIALQSGSSPVRRMRLHEEETSLQCRVDAWHDVAGTLLPGVGWALERHASITSPSPSRLQPVVYLPSVICSNSPVPEDFLECEWSLREAQAHDSLDDLRGHLEVLAYIRAAGADVDGALETGIRAVIIDNVQFNIKLAVGRYRSAFTSLKSIATALGKVNWQGYLHELHDDDIRYISDYDHNRPADMAWFWFDGGVSYLEPKDRLNISQNPSLSQALRAMWCKARDEASESFTQYNILCDEMRRVISFHGWYELWWEQRLGRAFGDRPDYQEGANAYAHTQAIVRRSLRQHCDFMWGALMGSLSANDHPSLEAACGGAGDTKDSLGSPKLADDHLADVVSGEGSISGPPF